MVKQLRLSGFLLGILIAFYWLLPCQEKFPQFEPFSHPDWLEQRLTDSLQQPVHIGQVTLHWQGFLPRLNLNDLTINSPEGIERFKAKRVIIGMDVLASILQQQVVLGDLFLEGTTIVLKELGHGKVAINDIPALEADLNSVNRAKIDALLTIFLSQGCKSLQDVNLVWYDQNGRVVLPLSKIDLTARSHFLRHDFFAHATTWDNVPIQFQGTVYGSYIAKHHLLNKIKINLEGVQLAKNPLLMRFLKKVTIEQGEANIQTMVTSTPYHTKFNGRFQAKQLQLLSPANQHYIFPSIQTQFNFLSRANKVWLNFSHLQFILGKNPIFRKDIAIKEGKGQLSWEQTEPNEWVINLSNYALKNNDGWIKGSMKLFLPNDDQAKIQSRAYFEMTDLKEAAKYYPINVLSPAVVTWLDRAIQGGALKKGQLVLNGALKDFPFDHDNGQFRVSGQLHQGILQYKKNWPIIRQLEAELLFEGRAMKLTSQAANILGTSVTKIKADIANLGKGLLVVDGQLHTNRAQTIEIPPDSNPLTTQINLSPKSAVTLTGPWQLGLHLEVPLAKLSPLPSHFKATIKLADVAVQMQTNVIAKHLQGNLMFADNMAQTNLLNGELFAKPFRLNINTSANVTEASFQYGSNSNGRLLFNTHESGFSFDRGEIRLDAQKAQLPDTKGLTIQGKVPEFNFSYWKNKFKSEHVMTTHFNLTYWASFLNRIDLFFEKVQMGERVFSQVSLQGRATNSSVFISLASKLLQGDIQVPFNYPTQPIKATIQKMKISPTDSVHNELSPADIPALDLSIVNCLYKDKTINHIDIKVRPIGSDLAIKQFTIDEPLLKLTASGIWRKNKIGQETVLSGNFESANLGAILNQWHITDNVVKGNGNANFALSWPDSPFNTDSKIMLGNVNLHFSKGRIIKLSNQANIGMSLGRILNLFSLQTLPKRLMLDFSDLTDSGFSFDEVTGDLQFKAGDVFTENATLEGTVAKIRVRGRIGLAKKDYDLQLKINPNVTSSLPIVATLTAGPIIGVATWAADRLFSHQMKKMTEIHYTVKGSWTNPDMQKL